jgi:hypothetical protein
MKYKKIIIGIFVMLVTACGENFLDVPLETALTSDTYFTKESDFTTAINSVYAPLRDLFSQYGSGNNSLYIMAETRSDNARYLINPTMRAAVSQENLADCITEASNGVTTAIYRRFYNIIARANQILATIDPVTFASQEVKDNVKGQALFLRAWSYFNLVQYFGKVPMHLTPVTTLEGTALPLSEVADIYSQITTDANDAISLLPPKSTQQAGSITNGAAKMLMANVYMVQQNYVAAETLLKEIIDDAEYSLMDTYAGVFNPADKNNEESIFEVQYRAGSDGYSSAFIYGMVPHPMTAVTLGSLTGITNPQGLTNAEGFNIPSPDIIEAYEPGDLRFDVTIDSTQTTDGTRYPFCRKYLHPHTQFQQSNDNWPVYRYAEVLLFLAEAINEQGKPVSDALDYINNPVGTSTVSIRGRAGLAPIVAADQAAARIAIANERRIELAFENKRWLDLVRTEQAVSVMTAYGNSIRANEARYYFPTGYNLSAQAFQTIDVIWPLPAEEALYSPYF